MEEKLSVIQKMVKKMNDKVIENMGGNGSTYEKMIQFLVGHF